MLIQYYFIVNKIQETPSEYPITKKVQKKSNWPTSEAQISTAKCEFGTVPIRQKEATSNHQRTPETGTNSAFTPQHEVFKPTFALIYLQ